MTRMSQQERAAYLAQLDERLLVGGVILSEWSTFLVRSADVAFEAGADLAALLTAQAAMESHLRYEYFRESKAGFYELIEQSPLQEEMRFRLHEVRRYRNRWVHVSDPGADDQLLDHPEAAEAELERMAATALHLVREVIYLEQCV